MIWEKEFANSFPITPGWHIRGEQVYQGNIFKKTFVYDPFISYFCENTILIYLSYDSRKFCHR